MITATPYFLARLSGSPFKSTFSSYLTTTFTLANFGFLAHATMTSKQVRMLQVNFLCITCSNVLVRPSPQMSVAY